MKWQHSTELKQLTDSPQQIGRTWYGQRTGYEGTGNMNNKAEPWQKRWQTLIVFMSCVVVYVWGSVVY